MVALAASLLLHGVAVALAPLRDAMTARLQSPAIVVNFEVPPKHEPVTPPAPAIAPAPKARPTARARPSAAPPPLAAPVPDVGSNAQGETPVPPATLPEPGLKFSFPLGPANGPAAAAGSAAGGGGDARTTEASLNHEIRPAYPEHARAEGVEGAVELLVSVAADGTVEDVRVLSGPSAELEAAAVAAMKRAHFTPATRGGAPVRSKLKYRYVFELQ